MQALDLPLPTIVLPPSLTAWEWPRPSFLRRDAQVSRAEGAQPCRIETLSGVVVDGDLTAFEPAAAELHFRVGPEGEALQLPFAKFHRLTLTTPWRIAQAAHDKPVERVSAAAQEREVVIELDHGGRLVDRTLGHIRQPEGCYLYAPIDDGSAVLQQFVPAQVCRSITFGASAAEKAAESWIATRTELLKAVAAQRHARVRTLGEALLELGLVTTGELERAVNAQGADRAVALGSVLVAQGVIDEVDLQTALACKMGYPTVDLARFPIDAAAAGRLPHAALQEYRALPLVRDASRLIVAVDDLRRIPALQALSSMSGLEVVPVLAPRGRLSIALRALPQQMGSDLWADLVPIK